LLTRFNLTSGNPVSTPLPPGTRLSATDSPSTSTDMRQMSTTPYRELVGSLLYLSVAT
ncbi:hypothetical protein BC829DRAFT_356631, partial [Chytridium lagenaria]